MKLKKTLHYSNLQHDSSITRRRSSPENVVVPNDSLSATNINKVLAPPAVRRRAREHNIDLSYVTGTGPAGRIKQIDLDHYINANDSNINGSKDQMLPSNPLTHPSPMKKRSGKAKVHANYCKIYALVKRSSCTLYLF